MLCLARKVTPWTTGKYGDPLKHGNRSNTCLHQGLWANGWQRMAFTLPLSSLNQHLRSAHLPRQPCKQFWPSSSHVMFAASLPSGWQHPLQYCLIPVQGTWLLCTIWVYAIYFGIHTVIEGTLTKSAIFLDQKNTPSLLTGDPKWQYWILNFLVVFFSQEKK